MKKLNTLKLIVAIGLASVFNAEAQFEDFGYWNSATTNAKDVGQAIALDGINADFYVAGEQNVGLASQALRFIKYDQDLNQLVIKKYDSTDYKETVKQIIYQSSKIYVLGNATDNSGASVMFLLRLNTSLTIEKVKWYKTSKYNSPVGFVRDGNNNFYIACYKEVSGVNKFAMLKVDANFTTLNSSIPSDSTYKRSPKNIYFNGSNVYVVGNAKSGSIQLEYSGFAMRFSNTLGLVWEYNGSKSNLSQNGYNTMAFNSNYAYVGGSEFNNNDMRWVMKRLNINTGVLSATHRTGGTNFSGDIGCVVKITLATSDSVYVAGYVKNQSANTFILKSAKYNSSLGGYQSANSTMSYGSILNDAITYSNGRHSILTGSSLLSGENKFFFKEFDNYSMTTDGFYQSVDRNSAGNKIILTTLISNPYAAIVGFEDVKSGAQPEDLRMMTVAIWPQINRLSVSSSSGSQSLFTMFPNPAADEVTIESKEPISSFAIYDMIGKSIMESKTDEASFQKNINISTLPKGIYLLKVNNNATQKLIKN